MRWIAIVFSSNYKVHRPQYNSLLLTVSVVHQIASFMLQFNC